MTFQWPNGNAVALSFSYDDGYPEGASIAAPQLEEHGIRGTFYLTWSFMHSNVAAWKRVQDAGHELGNHTFTHPHPYLETHFASATDFSLKETGPMEQKMNESFGVDDYRTYRYPGGLLKLGPGTEEEKLAAYQEVMLKTFIAASPGHWDTQDPLRVREQRFLLGGSAPTWGENSSSLAIDFMTRTLERGHWGNLIFHEVVDRTNVSIRETSKLVHEEIIKFALSKKFWIAPFRDVFNYVVKETASVATQGRASVGGALQSASPPAGYDSWGPITPPAPSSPET